METLFSKENMFALFSQKDLKRFLAHDFGLKFSVFFFFFEINNVWDYPANQTHFTKRNLKKKP